MEALVLTDEQAPFSSRSINNVGYYFVRVEVVKRTILGPMQKNAFGEKFQKIVGQPKKVYFVKVHEKQMGRIKVGDVVSFKRAGFFSSSYYILGDEKAGRFTKTRTGVLISKR